MCVKLPQTTSEHTCPFAPSPSDFTAHETAKQVEYNHHTRTQSPRPHNHGSKNETHTNTQRKPSTNTFLCATYIYNIYTYILLIK